MAIYESSRLKNDTTATRPDVATEVRQIEGKVSVVMPGYNEGQFIYKNLLATVEIMEGISNDFEIIFVNDGSADDTLDKANMAAAQCDRIKVYSYPENRGKGNALKAGVEKATGDYIAFLDSDLELHPSQLLMFYNRLLQSEADVVIGSKLHPESKTSYPLRRRIISTGYYIGLRVLFRLNVRDTQTGLKLFKAEIIKPVMQTILVKKFAYDIEVLAIINRLGCRIVEAPIVLSFSRGQKWGRIRLNDIFDVLTDTLAIFYRMYILKYYDINVEYSGKKEDILVNTKT